MVKERDSLLPKIDLLRAIRQNKQLFEKSKNSNSSHTSQPLNNDEMLQLISTKFPQTKFIMESNKCPYNFKEITYKEINNKIDEFRSTILEQKIHSIINNLERCLKNSKVLLLKKLNKKLKTIEKDNPETEIEKEIDELKKLDLKILSKQRIVKLIFTKILISKNDKLNPPNFIPKWIIDAFNNKKEDNLLNPSIYYNQLSKRLRNNTSLLLNSNESKNCIQNAVYTIELSSGLKGKKEVNKRKRDYEQQFDYSNNHREDNGNENEQDDDGYDSNIQDSDIEDGVNEEEIDDGYNSEDFDKYNIKDDDNDTDTDSEEEEDILGMSNPKKLSELKSKSTKPLNIEEDDFLRRMMKITGNIRRPRRIKWIKKRKIRKTKKIRKMKRKRKVKKKLFYLR